MKTETIRRGGFVIHHRPDTLDLSIFDQVHCCDEYRLRHMHFHPEDTILDIGGHLGFFALKVLDRGAGHVHLYEISDENIELCRRNLALFEGRFTIHQRAVWSETGRTLSFGAYPDWEGQVNTGGVSPFDEEGLHQVDTVAFDEVVQEITDGFKKRIRLLKIDAEGSEFPVLLTSKSLGCIDEIVGEYHEYGGPEAPVPDLIRIPGVSRYTRREIAQCLRRAGFRVRLRPAHGRWGLFFADRRPWWKALFRAFSFNYQG